MQLLIFHPCYMLFFHIDVRLYNIWFTPAIAGLSLGLAVFLTLLYVIIGYQNKRYTRMMRNGTTADDDDRKAKYYEKYVTLHSSSNRKKEDKCIS